jgi:hypothetical protein
VAADLNQRLKAIRQFNITLRQQLEAAELVVPKLNAALGQLGAAGIAADLMLAGDAVWRQRYIPGHGPSDSGQLYLAALKIPGGIGALVFDSEELCAIEQANPADPLYPAEAFLPFDECPSYVKASLLPRLPDLLRQLSDSFRAG